MVGAFHRAVGSDGAQSPPGELWVPAAAVGLVLLADVDRASAGDERSRWLAGLLRRQRLATLVVGLPSPAVAASGTGLMVQRLAATLDWVAGCDELAELGLCLLGSGGCTAAVLRVAAARPGQVRAVVTRGGRPELACDCLAQVFSPTLLLIGDGDAEALAVSRQTLLRLHCRRRLEVVPGARPPDEAPGPLSTVGALAAAWFTACLAERR